MPGYAKKILNKNDCPSILSKRSSLKNDGENARSGPGYLAISDQDETYSIIQPRNRQALHAWP